jgi:bifunctional non-homologous end joining protein LigD
MASTRKKTKRNDAPEVAGVDRRADPPSSDLHPAELPGALRAPLPDFVEPQLCAVAASPPAGQDWCHEIKLDGYRILARVAAGQVALFSRRENDWTQRIPDLARALRTLPCESALLDGELVALDAHGRSDFGRLQEALGRGLTGKHRASSGPLAYYAFDLLYLDGVDLRGATLLQRKGILRRLVARAPAASLGVLRVSDHIVGRGPEFFARAAHMGLEGIVSKRLDARYRSGRGASWLKVKHVERQELVIVGFTRPRGSRAHLGALLVASPDQGGWLYRGRVGTGFTEGTLRALHDRLAPLAAPQPDLVRAPRGPDAADVRWVRPVLVAQISFAGITRDGLLRHATFLGLREDKAATEVVWEEPRTGPT